MWQPNANLTGGDPQTAWQTTGLRQYELSNHLGNVLATITDKRLQHTTNNTAIDYYEADISTAQDYYAFGSQQPGRSFAANSNYRYGFNGKENDNDVGKGIGNQQDYGMRIYDGRLGRFLSVDPITAQYPELTPYQFASNRPIDGIDQDGLEYASSMTKAFSDGAQKGEDPLKAVQQSAKTTYKFIGSLIYGAAAVVFAPFNGISEAHYANNSKTPEQRAYHNSEANKYFKETAFNIVTAELGGELFGKLGKALSKQSTPFVTIGRFSIESGIKFSESEVRAGAYMQSLGYDVTLRKPVGIRAVDGQTSDLVINGNINYDVYTPTTSNVSRMVKAIANKNNQATGIVVDLSKSSATAADLENILQRVRGTGAKNITDIKVIDSKPQPNAGN
ncbi:hypothetical protein GCM10007352_29020 [Mucilaginibacter phyllosphaerae]|nr:RHS repeat-associated core domain-containing protein [Mucilaginibacter phyllosphaerae]MBB3969655.1 RHS repeat-associated protein [Mucilaginibacter phyllosphaerae]GGH18357.1 hypothetical protein GCM10007352_29020 [Mucilaginibacter phyllosphaerae]